MTDPSVRPLKERAELVLTQLTIAMPPGAWKANTAIVEQALREAIEAAAQVAAKRLIPDVEIGGSWDNGYNMAVRDIAQAIRRELLD